MVKKSKLLLKENKKETKHSLRFQHFTIFTYLVKFLFPIFPKKSFSKYNLMLLFRSNYKGLSVESIKKPTLPPSTIFGDAKIQKSLLGLQS